MSCHITQANSIRISHVTNNESFIDACAIHEQAEDDDTNAVQVSTTAAQIAQFDAAALQRSWLSPLMCVLCVWGVRLCVFVCSVVRVHSSYSGLWRLCILMQRRDVAHPVYYGIRK